MGGRAQLYFVLTIVGALVPLTLFGIFFGQEGLDFGELVDQIFGSPAAAAIMADATISSIVFWVWMFPEARRIGVSPWGFVAANLLVGLSFGLPLFLYARERRATAP